MGRPTRITNPFPPPHFTLFVACPRSRRYDMLAACPPAALARSVRNGATRRPDCPAAGRLRRVGRRSRAERRRVLREGSAAAARRALPQVPRRRQGQGRSASSPRATALLEGGDSGPAVVPGKPDDSLLIQAVRYNDTPKMPPDGKLADPDIDVLTRWVRDGPALAEGGRASPRRPASSRSPTSSGASGRSSRSRTSPPPAVKDAAWPATPIDRFLQAKREAKGLKPVGRRRQAHPDPPRHVRPDRPAADAGGDRRLPGGRLAGRLREGGRPAAGVAALRRALGPALARRGPLRRHRRRDGRLPGAARRTAIATTSSTPSTPTSPTTSSCASSSPATSSPRTAPPEQLRRATIVATGYLAVRPPLRLRPAELSSPHDRGHDRHAGQGGPRPDARLRPLPRPQVRPDLAGGLLRPLRHLRQHALPLPRLRGSARRRATSSPLRGPDRSRAYAVAEGDAAQRPIQKRGDPTAARRRGAAALPRNPRRRSRCRADARAAAGCELAGWLTDPKNPLTARVMVNRIWQHHFGAGLVRDAERLRHAGPAADASGIARLSRRPLRAPTAGRSRRCTG